MLVKAYFSAGFLRHAKWRFICSTACLHELEALVSMLPVSMYPCYLFSYCRVGNFQVSSTNLCCQSQVSNTGRHRQAVEQTMINQLGILQAIGMGKAGWTWRGCREGVYIHPGDQSASGIHVLRTARV